MGLWLRVQYRASEGDAHGQWELTQLPVRFGRNPMNDCVILHPQVSNFHAVVELIDGQLGVRDLNSKNGVFSPSSVRLQPERFAPLAAMGNAFALGPFVHVQIEPFEHELRTGLRMSRVEGQVIGRPSMLDELLHGKQRSEPPGAHGAGRPSLDSSYGVSSLPALSLDGSGAPQRPPPQRIAWTPASPRSPDDPRSLPPLDPLPTGYGQPPAAGPRPSASAATADGPGARDRSTQQFAMTIDALAVAGLRELAASLVPGAQLRTTGDVARLLTKLHDTVEVFCRSFIPLRAGYEQFVSTRQRQRAAEQRFVNRSDSALAIETARDPATVAAALLDWRNADFDAPKAVESILADLVMHHVALVENVMRGVQTLLDELSPESLERALAENGPRAAFGRYRALWRLFKERYDELANTRRTFELVFGEDFAASYREFLAQKGGPER